MKKIFGLIMLLAGVVSFTSCSNDEIENPYAHQSTVVVKSADVEYKAVGGTGTIVVESPSAISVSTTSDWVTTSVSGSTINVSVATNPNVDGRSAQLVIKNGVDEASVTITQLGLVSRLSAYEMEFTDLGGTQAVAFMHDVPVSVKSLNDWLTVQVDDENGRLLVSAESNDEMTEREGKVVVVSGEVTDTISVLQDALVFKLEKTSISLLNDGGSETVTIEHSRPVTIEASVDWIACQFNEKTNVLTVTVDKNPGLARQGTITVKTVGIEKTISVIQYDPASLGDQMLGDYYLLFLNKGKESGVYATLTEDALVLPALGWSIPVTIDKEKLTVTINSGSFVGTYNYSGTTLYMYLLFLEENGQYWSANSTNFTVTANLGLEDIGDGELTLAGDFEGILHGSKISDFLFSAFLSQTLDVDSDDYLGELLQWSSLTLMKIPEEAEARTVSKRSMQVSKNLSIKKNKFRK